jgi:hypothetical protein
MSAEGLAQSRRSLLVGLAAAPLIGAVAPALADLPDADREILAIDAKIAALDEKYEAVMAATRPFEDAREELRCKLDGVPRTSSVYRRARAAVDAFDRQHGLDVLYKQSEGLTSEICDLRDEMFALVATSPEARRAKVRMALRMAHCRLDRWRGPAEEIDHSHEIMRHLLGEYAGFTEAELAAI